MRACGTIESKDRSLWQRLLQLLDGLVLLLVTKRVAEYDQSCFGVYMSSLQSFDTDQQFDLEVCGSQHHSPCFQQVLVVAAYHNRKGHLFPRS